MKIHEARAVNLVTSILLCFFTLMFLLNMDKFVDIGLPSPVSPIEFPYFISVFLFIASIVYVCSSLLAFRGDSRGERAEDAIERAATQDQDAGKLLSCVIYIAILYLYYFLISCLGFLIATPIVMLAVSCILGAKRYHILIPAYIGFSVLLHFTALKLMKMDLPTGLLFE